MLLKSKLIELGAVHGKVLDLNLLVEVLRRNVLDVSLEVQFFGCVVNQFGKDLCRFRTNVVNLVQIALFYDQTEGSGNIIPTLSPRRRRRSS